MTKNKVWKLLGNIIFYAVLITLIAISGFSLNSVRKGVQPSFFGYKFFTVLTGSMSPTININDLVIVKEVKPEEIKVNDIITFGKLMNDSHISLRDDYEVTGKELDTLAEVSWKQPGVLGARMTGAGFGGCAIAIVNNDSVENFIANVGQAYKDAIGYEASFYIASIGDGPTVIEI